MYPESARTESFPPPTIITRTPADETLFPNDSNCRRFNELSRAFAQRTADRWNDSTEMEYLNNLLSKWMPSYSKRVAVDSHPRLSGIMDTVNSTLAHGPETRLPSEFYDSKLRAILDKIGVEEWFSGYMESTEYRMIGIGGLVGDLVSRMTSYVDSNSSQGAPSMEGKIPQRSKTGMNLQFAMSGCHDTTLGAILASLGAFTREPWPPYTSHIALELFRKTEDIEAANGDSKPKNVPNINGGQSPKWSLWTSIFGLAKENITGSPPDSQGLARKTMDELSTLEKEKLRGYYVRIRYNDRPMTIPGCKLPGNHLEGDESFCTLEAFKSIADKFTPKNWKGSCVSNMGQPAFPKGNEDAGY